MACFVKIWFCIEKGREGSTFNFVQFAFFPHGNYFSFQVSIKRETARVNLVGLGNASTERVQILSQPIFYELSAD